MALVRDIRPDVTYSRIPTKATFKPIQTANTISSVDILFFLAHESEPLKLRQSFHDFVQIRCGVAARPHLQQFLSFCTYERHLGSFCQIRGRNSL
jgi:hypothetical protein